MSRLTIVATTIFAAIALSTTALAEQGHPESSQGKPAGSERHGPSPEQFQKMKSKMLENHQRRVEILQHGQSCIQAAANVEQLKTCHQQERQAHEQLRDQLEGDKKALREQREEKGDKH